MPRKLQPTAGRLVLKRIKAENVTDTGIILPDQSNKPTQMAEVVAVGEQEEETYIPGQTVLYAKYTETEVKLDNQDFLLVHEDDVLAIVVEEYS